MTGYFHSFQAGLVDRHSRSEIHKIPDAKGATA